VTCASEGLYVIFRFPAGLQVTAGGLGGGPAVGFSTDGLGAPGWLCKDGVTYDKVDGAFGFAVLPVLVNAEPGMLQLQGIQIGGNSGELIAALVTDLESPYPNPFNPETVVKYSLAEAGDVDLSVFDLRGRLVNRLAQGFHQAGRYQLTWHGEDGSGRKVSSGVYFLRFRSEAGVVNRRLALIK